MWNKIKYYVYTFGAGIAAALLIIFRGVDNKTDKKLKETFKDDIKKLKEERNKVEEVKEIKEDWYKEE